MNLDSTPTAYAIFGRMCRHIQQDTDNVLVWKLVRIPDLFHHYVFPFSRGELQVLLHRRVVWFLFIISNQNIESLQYIFLVLLLINFDDSVLLCNFHYNFLTHFIQILHLEVVHDFFPLVPSAVSCC